MINGQPTDYLLDAIWTWLSATFLATPKGGLYTNNPTLTRGTLLSDLTQPTFAGYAEVALVPEALVIDAQGNYILKFETVTFQPSGAVTPNQTATGCYIVNTVSATDHLVLAGSLIAPFTFAVATDGLDIQFEMVIPNALIYALTCTSCPTGFA